MSNRCDILSPMKNQGFSVGIDVGSHTTRIVVARPTKSGMRVIAHGYSPTHGVRQGFIVHQEHVLESVLRAKKMAEDMAQIKITEARIAISGITLETHTVHTSVAVDPSVGMVTNLHLAELQEKARYLVEQKFNNRRVLYVSPTDFLIDDESVLGSPEGLRGKKIQACMLVFTARDHHVSLLQKTIIDAGITPTVTIPGPIALAESIVSDYQKMRGVLVVDIGAETVSAITFESGVPSAMRVFSIGGSDITGDIALGLQLPLDDAESAKLAREIDDIPQKKLETIIRARLEDIFELVHKYLENIDKEKSLPAGVVLSGGGSRMTSLADYARESLRLPTQMARVAHTANRNNTPVEHNYLLAFGLCSPVFDDLGESQSFFGDIEFIDKIRKFFRQMMP